MPFNIIYNYFLEIFNECSLLNQNEKGTSEFGSFVLELELSSILGFAVDCKEVNKEVSTGFGTKFKFQIFVDLSKILTA